eukprot:SAG31_NODE_18335_length_640_cov_0.765250_1_plen_116_part_00
MLRVSAAKFDVEDRTLSNELQQLGLPKEHSDELCRSYRARKDQLRSQFAKESLRLPKLKQFDWRVDYVLSSSKLATVNAPTATLQVTRDDGEKPVAFEVSGDKFAALYSGPQNNF